MLLKWVSAHLLKAIFFVISLIAHVVEDLVIRFRPICLKYKNMYIRTHKIHNEVFCEIERLNYRFIV